MHAVIARRRGLAVTHLEREPEGRGASVRNFGLIWVSGRRAGPELALALRARQLWEEIAADAPGTGFRPAGSLTIASTEAELAVLHEAAALPDAGQRAFTVLSAAEVKAVNPGLAGDYLGALWCQSDAIAEPRLALRALRAYLADGGPGYDLRPGHEAVELQPHGVRDQFGRWHHGDLVVLCTGANFTGVTGPHLVAAGALAGAPGSGGGLRRVRLQMLQTDPFPGRLTTSVADGDSLRYYQAFDVSALAGLRDPEPIVAEQHMQLLIQQRLDGGLTVGDTHEYDEPFDVAVAEEPYRHLAQRVESIVGEPLPPVRRRWAGVYSQATDERLYHREQLAAGVWIVTGVGGRGMTLAPAIAEETLAAVGAQAMSEASSTSR